MSEQNYWRIGVQMGLDQSFKRHYAIFGGIRDYAKERPQWRLVIDDWAARELPAKGAKLTPYQGIIGRLSANCGRRAKAAGVPMVNVHFNSKIRDVDSIFVDWKSCARLEVEHLMNRGFRRFGILYLKQDRFNALQAKVFRELTADASSEVTTLALDGSFHSSDKPVYSKWKRANKRIDEWMDTWCPPIGLTISDLDMARVVIEKCLLRGYRVPEDVAIIAGDNEEELCECADPSITSIEMPFEEMGYAAAERLDALMKLAYENAIDVDPEPVTKFIPPIHIVARHSTDFFAVDDELIRDALRYINMNHYRKIRISDIARELRVSRSKLISRFREKVGRTINSEIERLRIDRAQREIYGSSLSLEEISRRVGFTSKRSFNRTFKKLVGCTPREYRQQKLPSH